MFIVLWLGETLLGSYNLKNSINRNGETDYTSF